MKLKSKKSWFSWTPVLAAAGAALFMAASPAAFAVPAGNGTMQGEGFDACAAPSSGTMQRWWTNTPWSFVGIYIGGVERGCSQANLTAKWLNTTYAQGWRYELLWVGPQAPCTTFVHRMSSNAGTAYREGKAEAVAAYKALTALGFGKAIGTPVTYDMEGYPDNQRCRAAVKAFMQGWVDQLSVAPAQVAGVYGSACGSHLDDYASMTRPPGYVTAAQWDRDHSTWHLSCIGGGHWTTSQRLKQFQGGHNETWGNVTINIDSDCANGPTAAGGHRFASSSCTAR
jgi:hypothetical protein